MVEHLLENERKHLLDLHLLVLKDLINGIPFEEIEVNYEERFRELDYLNRAKGNLLSFYQGKLVGAYPVSPTKTKYKVIIEDIGTGYAMCAIDALGIAYSFMKKTIVESYVTDTEETFSFEIDPFALEQNEEDLYVTYKKYNDKMRNTALDICPTINIYRFKERIPKEENLTVLEFETALKYAKERFSQEAIKQCFTGLLDTEQLMSQAQSTNFSSSCDC